MNHKSKSKPKPKNQSHYHNTNSQTVSQLMEKAKAAQVQRQKLLKAKCHMSLIKAELNITNKKNPDNKPQQPTTITNSTKQPPPQVSNTNNNLSTTQPLPIPSSTSIQSSFRPFQSNRTLQPYLINIRQEYICGAGNKQQLIHNKQRSNNNQSQLTSKQKEKINNNNKRQQPPQPVSNSESIQLSESREVSQQMLLHNSVTSKFLQSPTLSLGLVESKITKKQVDSQNNSKILKKKPLISNDYQTGQILFTTNNNNLKVEENEYNKQSIRFYQQLIKSFHDQQQQHQQAIKKKQLKDVSQQFPEDSKIMQDAKDNLNKQVIEGKLILPLMDAGLSNSIMASYQMQVQYLRKINLYQSFEIQKLRKLIRMNQSQHQESVSTSNHNQSCQIATQSITCNPSTKPQFKKAIDIIKRRQTINFHKKQPTQPLKQLDINAKNTSTDHTDLQFICGDNSTELFNHNNKRSISFTTNNQTTSDTFHINKKQSIVHNRKSQKSKAKKRALSISDKHNISYNYYQPDAHPLNYKSQSLNMSAQQMMNLSMGTNHNLSCSTYFMGTKSTNKKSNKCKTTHSERNLSTIVSEVNNNNKENCYVSSKNSVKVQNKKKMNRKGSILDKDVEMFVSTKKREGQVGMMTKKKR